MCDSTLYVHSEMQYVERKVMQSGMSTRLEPVPDPILIRRPAFPRRWDSIARPHVAVVVKDRDMEIRYYLSRKVRNEADNGDVLEVANVDDLPEGTLLEVRFNATKANLYRLENVDNVPCWRWIGRCRELPSFEYPDEIHWNGLLEDANNHPTDMMSFAAV